MKGIKIKYTNKGLWPGNSCIEGGKYYVLGEVPGFNPFGMEDVIMYDVSKNGTIHFQYVNKKECTIIDKSYNRLELL